MRTISYIEADCANALRFEEQVYDGCSGRRADVVFRETLDHLRWTGSVERVVFRLGETYFELLYNAPLTENQGYKDFVGDVAVREVFPKTKTVVYYE